MKACDDGVLTSDSHISGDQPLRFTPTTFVQITRLSKHLVAYYKNIRFNFNTLHRNMTNVIFILLLFK